MDSYLTPEQVERIKQQYPPGTRIQLEQMNDDPMPVEPGMCGTVKFVDDIGTIHCQFDNGRFLGVIWGVDMFHIIAPEEKSSFEEKLYKMSAEELEDYEISRFDSVNDLYNYVFKDKGMTDAGILMPKSQKEKIVMNEFGDRILKIGDSYFCKHDFDEESNESPADEESMEMS
mgnify:CR=1 FL=1